MKRQYPGYLISLEGVEGAGKSTQIYQLADRFKLQGLKVFVIREPGWTSIGEQIRDVVHSLRNSEIHHRTETLLYQAARAQVVEEVIIPRLKMGELGICDRFMDSSLVYQGIARGQDLDTIKFLIDYATGGLTPDLTVLLDLDPETGLNRITQGREFNRMDAQGLKFYTEVRYGYLELARKDPERWVVIDASKGIDEINIEIGNIITERLGVGFKEGVRREREF